MNIMRSPRRASRIGRIRVPRVGRCVSRRRNFLWEVREGGTPSPAPAAFANQPSHKRRATANYGLTKGPSKDLALYYCN